MRISRARGRVAVVAGGLLALATSSSPVWAQASSDTPSRGEAAQPHWSGLPIWGAEAEARGYKIPLPLGVGVAFYDARQPVNLQDLQPARRDNPPQSVTNFLQINRVDTSQRNASAKFDVLIFPFLDVYALAGYTTGTTKGLIQVPATPIFGLVEPAQLQLNASFKGPTYGAGVTLQGCARISDSPNLIAFAVADLNSTRTDLSFSNETLIARTKPKATVFSARLGLSGTAG